MTHGKIYATRPIFRNKVAWMKQMTVSRVTVWLLQNHYTGCRWCLVSCVNFSTKNPTGAIQPNPTQPMDCLKSSRHPSVQWWRLTVSPSTLYKVRSRFHLQASRRLGSRAPLSKFRVLPFRNKGLNQNSVETLYTGNVGHHYTKISENWIKNCRRISISRDPSEKWGFSFTVPPLGGAGGWNLKPTSLSQGGS